VAIHSANPTVQRREERLLRERLAAMDAKVDVLVKGWAKQAPPTPLAAAAQSPEVTALARDIGQDRILLPGAVIINRAWADDGSDEMIATSITFDRLTFTINEARRLGILESDGRFNHFRASTISHCTPRPGELMRPHHMAACPGRPSL
jgi:hypothetical protein